MPPSPFDLDDLSPRERAVLELAMEGYIDERIARDLGISVSTVNSYWVRIRGKLGHLSRTELVAGVLRERFRRESMEMADELARLGEEARHSDDDLAQSRSDLRASGGTPWHLLTLECAPVALVVARAAGLVAYANAEACRLLAASPGALDGTRLADLTVPDHRDHRERQLGAFFARNEPTRLTLGLGRPFFALRSDGTNFRAVVAAERFETATGTMAVLFLREFMPDHPDAIAELLRPYSPPKE